MEKMEFQNEVKTLKQNLEDEKNSILRIRAAKNKPKSQELQEQEEQSKALLEQTKFASFNHNMLID